MLVNRPLKVNTQAKGFTLLEVIITLGILMSMMFAISTLLRNSFDLKVNLSQKNRVNQRINLVMQKLSSDLEMAYLISLKDRRRMGSEFLRNRTLFTVQKGSNGDTLKMTYMGHQAKDSEAIESDFSYVVYELKEDEKNPGRRHLYRGELGRIPSASYDFKQDPPMHLFAKHIESLRIEAWNGDGWSKDGWDSTRGDSKDRLPNMLRLTIRAWERDPAEEGFEESTRSDNEPILTFATIVYLGNSGEFSEIKTRVSSFKIY